MSEADEFLESLEPVTIPVEVEVFEIEEEGQLPVGPDGPIVAVSLEPVNGEARFVIAVPPWIDPLILEQYGHALVAAAQDRQNKKESE